MSRVSFHNVPWTEEEREYLLTHAGSKTLEQIARRLNRTYSAMRGQLRLSGTASRHNQGFLSAAEIAKEYNCCYHRVCRMLKSGDIEGRFDKTRNRWEVDPIVLTQEVIKLLGKPRRTHKTWPLDRGDYYSRNGLCRQNINGRVIVVKIGERMIAVPRSRAVASSPAP